MFPVQAFGVPDPRMGEEMCACIRHREGVVLSEQQLRTFCREKVYIFQECGRPLLLATTLQYVTRRSRSHGTVLNTAMEYGRYDRNLRNCSTA